MKRTFTKNRSTRISRLLILTMVLALLVGCFAGCRKQEEEPNNDPQTPPNLVETDPPAPSESDPTEGTEPGGSSVQLQDNMATILEDQVNVRSAPSAESTVIGQLEKGDVVQIENQQTLLGVTWVKIVDSGWICLDLVSLPGGYVEPTEPDEPDETEPEETEPEETKPNENDGQGNGNTKTIAKGIVTASELNIRSKATVDSDRVGMLKYLDRVEILEKDGNWGRTSKGWISLDYVYQDGTVGKNSCKGVVTATDLNIRSGPGVKYEKVGSLEHGDRVNILEYFSFDGTKWACIDKGWICLDNYVYIDGTTGENSGTGKVTGNNVNIRTGPGTKYGTNGSANSGDVLKIYTQIKIDDMVWGCTDKGWIAMQYVEMQTNS